MIYLDHNATSPPRPEAVEEVRRAANDFFGNPSSQHAPGRKARAFLEECREKIAAVLSIRATEIIFTSGGTESNRLAIEAVARTEGARDKPVAAVFALEHPSILEPVARLEEEGRCRLVTLPSSTGGEALVEPLRSALRLRPRLVSLQHANNETGVIQPVREVADAIANEELPTGDRPLLHVDAAQSLGRVPCRPSDLGADLVSFSAHKLGGPRGAGALWVRRGAPFAASLRGGPQERGLRAGTEDVPAIAGFVAALELASADAERFRMEGVPGGTYLGRRLAQLLLERVEGVRVNGDRERLLPNTVNVSFDGVAADLLVIELDRRGVAVSTGSACASGSREPSRVLAAMGLPPERVRSAVRFSTGWSTRPADVEAAVEITRQAVEQLRSKAASLR